MKRSVAFGNFTKECQDELWTAKFVNFQGEKVSLGELFTQSEDCKAILNTDTLQTLVTTKETKVGSEVQRLNEPQQSHYVSRIFKKGDEERGEKDVLKSQDKIVLITGDAGLGKSTFVTKLATTIKNKNPSLWVIVIRLQDYIEIFMKYQRKGKNTITMLELLNCKATTRLRTPFQESVFQRSKSVVLLLDDIDQVFCNYTQLVLGLVAECQEAHHISKVILTSRPVVAKQIEKETGIVAFVLQPFTNQKLVEFLVAYWMYYLQLQEASKDKCEQYAKELIRKVSLSHHDIDAYFVRTPLGMQLLTELFNQCEPVKESAELEACREFLNADRANTNSLPKSIATISMLFERFIDEMRDIFIDKANGRTTEGEVLYEKCFACHRTLAVDAVLGENRCGLFSGSQQIDKKMEAIILQIGIVKKWENKLYFAYERIGQYFAAKSLLKELLQLPNQNVEFQKYFLQEFLFDPKHVVVRAFLDNFLRKVVDYLPSTIFHEYQLVCREVDEVNDLNLIHQLAQEGCTALLRLIFKCINYQIIRDEETSINDCTKIIANHSNTLKNLRLLTQRGGLNVKNESGKTPLHLAATGGYLDTVRFLTEQGANVDIEDNFGWTPLHFSAAEGHLDTVKFLVKQGANVNIKNHYWWSPLHFAAEKGHLDIAKFLIERKADVNTEDCDGITPLYSAALEGHLDIVKFLVTKGAYTNIKDRWGRTLLHSPSGRGHLDIVKFLLEKGADGNILNSYDRSPLHCATEGGHLDTVRFLVERGADLNIITRYDWMPLHSAIEGGHLNVAKFLVERGADMNIKVDDDWTPLHFAAYGGQLDIVKFLVEQGADVSTKDKDYETALHAAVSQGYLDVIKFLVERGADVNAKNNCGQTPLHFAAKEGQLDIVKCLVEQGANVDIKNHYGWSPLHFAVEKGHLDIVKFLIEWEADLNAQDYESTTVLCLAALKGHLDIVKFLVTKGADMDIKGRWGQTLLHYISGGGGHLDIVKFFVEKGADVNILNSHGHTPLYSAVEGGHLNITKFLVERGADINIKADDDCTPLHLAAYRGQLDIVKFLVEQGADVSTKDKDCDTSLHAAVSEGYLDVIKFFVERGADVNAKNNCGQTPLHFAAKDGQLDVVKFLVENGAVVDIEDDVNKRPLDFGARHLDIVNFLKK